MANLSLYQLNVKVQDLQTQIDNLKIFGQVSVNGSTGQSKGINDSLKLVQGANVQLTLDTNTNTVKVDAVHTHPIGYAVYAP